MGKQIVIIGIIVLLIFVGLSGCNEVEVGNSLEKKFVGKWLTEAEYSGSQNFILFDNGTAFFDNISSASWEIKNDTLVVDLIVYNLQSLSYKFVFYYTAEDDYQTLTLKIGSDTITFTKVE